MTAPRISATGGLAALVLAAFALFLMVSGDAAISAQTPAAAPRLIERFQMPASGPVLERPSRAGTFIASIGARAAALGAEHRPFELWVWPLKIVDDLDVGFSLEGYPLSLDGRDVLTSVSVRPESTTLVYTHAAFTVRQIFFVPPGESAIVMLFDVKSVLPLQLTVRFRPRLRLMWPGTSMTPFVSWDATTQAYDIGEESGRLAAVIAAPGARDQGVQPYQEEPRDVPVAFTFDPARYDRARQLPVVVITGSVEGRAAARAAATRVLSDVPALYAATVAHYRDLLASTLEIETPDARLNRAFTWAKVGIDKALATNPTLGTGLLAGFRTSGDSERPGFAWFFGRDALWSALATTAYGQFETTRTALRFLEKQQRADGKIPHEVSQSAAFVPWFTGYPYAWASADATPLFVIAHADYWQASGDRAFLDASWPAILKAYEFSRATDQDGNGLIENTKVGHGWVEGGALYPPHEEIYLQALWIEAQRDLAMLARVRGEEKLAAQADAGAARVTAAVESTYWLPRAGHYAFATRTSPAGLIAEDTVLPAVPLWWRQLDPAHAQLEVDHLGGHTLATDWGTRLLSNASKLYDPLSYHYGSVWPLFTGWTSMAAYRQGRPHVGYAALMANALLTEAGTPGSITELISGDFDTPFGRSSPHQTWSQAMVATPLVRGLLGIAVEQGGGGGSPGSPGSLLRFEPQLPAGWPSVHVRRVPLAGALYDVDVERTATRDVINVSVDPAHAAHAATPAAPAAPASPASSGSRPSLVIAPALPLDATVTRVVVGGRPHPFTIERDGDIQRVRIAIDHPLPPVRIEIAHSAGSDVSLPIDAPMTGAVPEGLYILRVRPEGQELRVLVEGRAQRTYRLTIADRQGTTREVPIRLEGPADDYVRQELRLPLK